MNVTHLAQHILSLFPDPKDESPQDVNAARLCFFNYLSYLCDPEAILTADMLNRFFRRALTFSHWQENQLSLFQEVFGLIQQFLRVGGLPPNGDSSLVFDEVLTPDRLQVLHLNSQKNLFNFVKSFVAPQLVNGATHKLLPIENNRIVSIILNSDRSLDVQVFSPLVTVIDGELEPLHIESTLRYSPDLMLQANWIQEIDIGSFTTARFNHDSMNFAGVAVRGYTFQKYLQLSGSHLHESRIIFFPLKRLEQIYINRKTDPMYIELAGMLERASELLTSEHPGAIEYGAAALERGRLALEHIFPEDKLVRLLVNNLEKTLAWEMAKPGTARSTNHLVHAESQAPTPPPRRPHTSHEVLKSRQTRGSDSFSSPRISSPAGASAPAKTLTEQNLELRKKLSPASSSDVLNKKSEKSSWEKIRPLNQFD